VKNELKKLLKYCEGNAIKVVFTDSEILKDYAGTNPEVQEQWGIPDVDNNMRTQEIVIDETLLEATQIEILKHELIEMRLMRQYGMKYWDAHVISLSMEKEPFDFSQPIPKANVVRVGNYEGGQNLVVKRNKPKQKGWRKLFARQKTSVIGVRQNG
jgi:hypothetical protein